MGRAVDWLLVPELDAVPFVCVPRLEGEVWKEEGYWWRTLFRLEIWQK
jgi:hypothetical protein